MAIPWGRLPSSAFYSPKTRTSTMFIKRSVKCIQELSAFREAGSHYFFLTYFCISIIHPKKNYSKIHYFLIRFINNNEKSSPFFEEVKYAVFRDLALYIFQKHIIWLHLKILLITIPLGYAHASHKYTDIIITFSFCRRLFIRLEPIFRKSR